MARTKQTARMSTARPTATKVWVEASAEGKPKRAKVEKAEKAEAKVEKEKAEKAEKA